MKKLKPQRKQAGSRNPLRKLQARDDIQLEYTEVRTDVAEKELRRIKREQSKFITNTRWEIIVRNYEVVVFWCWYVNTTHVISEWTTYLQTQVKFVETQI